MDMDDFRSVLESLGVDVWTFIDTAFLMASKDFGPELKQRRDTIVERLYAMTSSVNRCLNCESNVVERANGDEVKGGSGLDKENNHGSRGGGAGDGGGRGGGSPSTPRYINGEDDDDDNEVDPYGGMFDDEQKTILDIKQQLEDPDQSEESLVDLLQSLADMDITFQALKETDIGRHVNLLRKHSSNDVRRLVKQLVRKWKEIVDEWVRLNPQGEQASSALMADGDSPHQKIPHNGHHQVPDFAYSPNTHNGNNSESERKLKPVPPRKEIQAKPTQQSAPRSASAPHNLQRQKEQQKERDFDMERLASARKRLQANYKEAENAKKQRTIQVMDIHEIPKPKNAYFAKNKGGSSQGKHW